MMRICRRSAESLYQINGDLAMGVQTSKNVCRVVEEGAKVLRTQEPSVARLSCRAGGD